MVSTQSSAVAGVRKLVPSVQQQQLAVALSHVDQPPSNLAELLITGMTLLHLTSDFHPVFIASLFKLSFVVVVFRQTQPSILSWSVNEHRDVGRLVYCIHV